MAKDEHGRAFIRTREPLNEIRPCKQNAMEATLVLVPRG
jgi:hypothetical protein